MLRRSKNVLEDLDTKTIQLCYISPPEGLGAYGAVYNGMSL
ncbi:hypothetical protein [Xenophilus azovorans]|nr:hypothetical protein [Xenophilus azovorans]